MDKKLRMQELIDEIRRLNYHYYTMDEPLLSDKEYDALYDQLLALERETGLVLEDSPSQKVGGEILEGFEKHRHLGRLWSLDKSQSFQELRDWEKRVRKLLEDHREATGEQLEEPVYVMEYKFDGLTLNLTYDRGQLIQAASRGNGTIGEGILAQVKVIDSIPKTIDFQGRMEVQGEGLMPLSSLEAYNARAEEPLKNARNAAAGALRNLDTSVTRERNLAAYFYNIGYIEGREFRDHIEVLDFLKDNLIPVFPYRKEFHNMEDLIQEIEIQDQARHQLDVLTDGLVIKLKDIRSREVLGYTNKFPRWAIAYKFEAEEVTTQLLDVVWSVGRTGKLTPTAILEPVEIGGAQIGRATLNNYDDIVRKNVSINSRVLLRRSNDVIPEILGSLPTEGELIAIEKPEKCPACQSDVEQDGVHIFCHNSLSCKPQLISRLVHFASRDAMNIEGFSEKTAGLLLEELDLRELAQLYELKEEDLLGLEGFKEKKTQNLLGAIEASKKVDLASFIYALGIKNVGIKTATDLAQYYQSFDSFRQANYQELIGVGEVGEVIANNILEFIQDATTMAGIEKLFQLGVEPSYQELETGQGIFRDKTLVLTGTIEGMKRSDLKKIIQAEGGKVTGSVSRNTDYLIAGESSGSKYNEAVELGIEIIDQEKLMEILKNIIA